MTLADLIDTLTMLDAAVLLVEGKSVLRLPKGTDSRAVLKGLGDDLVIHREGVLAHFAAVKEHPGRECLTCGAVMYHDSAEEQFCFCGTLAHPATVTCPAAPAWAKRHVKDVKDYAEYAAKKKAVSHAPVPD